MYERQWKGKFPAMVYGMILLGIFLLNCAAVVGVDAALKYPYSSQEAAMAQLDEYPVADLYGGYSRWNLQLYLLETEEGMAFTAVEKHFLLDRYRVISQGAVVEGQRASIWGGRGKVSATIIDGQLEGVTLTPLEIRLIPNTGIYVPTTIFFLCLGLMAVELVLYLVFRKLRDA